MKKKGLASISSQLRVSLLGMIVLSLLLTGGTLGYVSFMAQLNQQRLVQSANSLATAEKINSYIDDLTRHLYYLAGISGLSTFDTGIQNDLLKELVNSNRAYEITGLVDAKGQLLTEVSPTAEIVPTDWGKTVAFRHAFQEREDFIGPVELDAKQGWPTLVIATPIRDSQNQVDGMLFAKINLKFLWAILAATKTGQSGYAFVLDQRNWVIARSGGLPADFVLEDVSQKPIASAAFTGTGDSLQIYQGLYDTQVLGSSARTSSGNWRVVTELPLAEVYAPAINYLMIIGSGLAISIIVALALGSIISRQITEPLAQLTRGATRFSHGDMETRVAVLQANELKTLADAFNFMAEKVQNTIVDLQQEVAERKQAEARLVRVNRLYATLGQINQAVVRTHDRDSLFSKVCQVAVEAGQFRMAWIGLSHATGGSVKPAAFAGDEQGYLTSLRIVLGDPQLGGGPTGIAIREGRCVICQNIAHDPRMAPWREQALQRGFRASASVPIFQDNESIGALTVYSSEPQGFTNDDEKLLDEIGQTISYALGSIQAETARKDAEEAIHTSEREFRILAEAMPQIVWICGPDGRNIYFNQQWVDYTGLTLEESYGDGWNKPFHPDDQLRAWAAWQNAIQHGAVYSLECRLRRADGDYLWWLVRGVPLPGNGGEIVKWFGTCTDINELKIAQQTLSAKNTELAAMSQQLWQAAKLATVGELAASIAHELNNPLQIASLHIEALLGSKPTDDPRQEALGVVMQEIERMARLVSNLLQFSRRSTGHKSTLNVQQEVSDTLELVSHHLGSHKIAVIVEAASDLPRVQADRQELRQVLLNLITNADDAMPNGGTLAIRLWANEASAGSWPAPAGLGPTQLLGLPVSPLPQMIVEISDTGVGITAEGLARVWEPFYTTKPEGKGTGLGLPICRRIVEELGGRIEIASKGVPGEGTTVRVGLPIEIVHL